MASIAWVQEARVSGYPIDSLAYGSNVTSGNLLVCLCHGDSAVAVAVGSDRSAGFTKAIGSTGSSQFSPSIWYAKATSSGACTVTITPTAGTDGIVIFEFSGQHATTPLDVTNPNTGTSANPSNTKATVADNDLVVAFLSHDAGVASGVTAGYTLHTQSDAGNGIYGSDAYNVDVGTAGSKTVTFTDGTSTNAWEVLFAAFKPATVSAVLMGQVCL